MNFVIHAAQALCDGALHQAGRFLTSSFPLTGTSLILRLVYVFNRLGISMLKFHRRFIAVSLVVFAGFSAAYSYGAPSDDSLLQRFKKQCRAELPDEENVDDCAQSALGTYRRVEAESSTLSEADKKRVQASLPETVRMMQADLPQESKYYTVVQTTLDKKTNTVYETFVFKSADVLASLDKQSWNQMFCADLEFNQRWHKFERVDVHLGYIFLTPDRKEAFRFVVKC